jgi:hypothetical protein
MIEGDLWVSSSQELVLGLPLELMAMLRAFLAAGCCQLGERHDQKRQSGDVELNG